MKRVMIVGGPGSGKSTLARRLAKLTHLPIYHMDKIHWKSGWVERNRDEKDHLTHQVHMLEEWIFEGGHSRTYSERIERADTFIWLDLPLGLRVWRVLLRSWQYRGRTRPDLPKGCPERFNRQTVDFLKFIWTTRHSSRRKLEAIYKNPPAHLNVYRFTSTQQLDLLMQRLSS